MYSDRLSIVKGHRSTLANKEREVLAREQALIEKEQRIASLLSQKDQEIASLLIILSANYSSHISHRNKKSKCLSSKLSLVEKKSFRVLVYKREEAALAMAQREEEIMEAVRQRGQQLSDAWTGREAEIKKEAEDSLKSIDERIQWVAKRENDLLAEETRLNELQEELEERMRKIDEGVMKGSFCFLRELFPLD